MNRRMLSLLVLALMASTSLVIPAGATSLTVSTGRLYYSPGEDVEIYGIADAEASVTIIVNDPQGTIYDETVTADASGMYSTTFTLPEDGLAGLYTVTTSTDDAPAHTSFTVTLMDLQTLAERLLSLVEEWRAQVEAAFDRLEAEGIEVPDDAGESFDQGFDALEEALQL